MTAKRTRKPSPAVLEARAYYGFIDTLFLEIRGRMNYETDLGDCILLRDAHYVLLDMADARVHAAQAHN